MAIAGIFRLRHKWTILIDVTVATPIGPMAVLRKAVPNAVVVP